MGSGASKRVTLEGKTTEQARTEAAAQVQQLVSGMHRTRGKKKNRK
jgi:hypothetical protein